MSGAGSDFIKIVGECDVESIELDQGNFTQISVPERLTIPEQKPDVEQVLKVMVEGLVTSLRLVDTPDGTASSGMSKTGKGLVVEGKLHQKVIYVAENEEGSQPVHSAEFNIPFSTFIIINTSLLPGDEDEIDVEVCIEDIFVELINQREVFKNVTILVNAIVPETDPTVTILEPSDESEFAVNTVIPIKVRGEDHESLDRVELIITDASDEEVLNVIEPAAGVTTLLHTFDWDTDSLDAGDYTVEATAYDTAGNEDSQSITITLTA